MPFGVSQDNSNTNFDAIANSLDQRRQSIASFVGGGTTKPSDSQTKSVFSSLDNNKNGTIELTDTSAKQYMVSAFKLDKRGVDSAIQKELNFDAKNEYITALNSKFTKFSYTTTGPMIDPDREVKSNLDSQASNLSQEIQRKYNQAVANVKSAVNDGTYTQLKTDYDTALNMFMQRLKKDGICEDIADGISKLWNNSVINLTGNTADMVRADLKKYSDKLGEYKSINNTTTRAKIAKDLKAMNIVNRVADYCDSQETGGFAVKATVVTGTMLACPAAAGLEGACTVLTAVNAVDAFTSQDGLEHPLRTAGEVAADGVLTYGGAKFGKAVVKGLAKTGAVQAVGTAIEENLAPTVAKYTTSVGGYVLGNATQSFANASAQTGVRTAGTLAYTTYDNLTGGVVADGTTPTVQTVSDQVLSKTGQKAFERTERHATYAAIGYVRNFIHK